MAAKIRPLTKAEAAAAPDPDAPFGRDDDKTPKAPFGYMPNGQIKLNTGRPTKLDPSIDLDAATWREVLIDTFNQNGGMRWIKKWAKANPDKFFSLMRHAGPRQRMGHPVRDAGGTTSVASEFSVTESPSAK